MSQKSKDSLEIIIIYVFITLVGVITYQYLSLPNEMLRFLIADFGMTLSCFVFSVWKKNSSVYDAYWSYIPFLFIVQWFVNGYMFWGISEFLTAFTLSFWSWRLSHNWYRSWSGWDHEDWRYVNFRKQFGKHFQWINFSAIHLYPTLIVFLSMTGLFSLYDSSMPHDLNAGIILGNTVSLIGVLLELFADNTLYAERKNVSRIKGTTIRSGLWGQIRNPNYLGEMLFWVGLALIGISSGAAWWTTLGSIGMILMFVFASIPMKEKRLLSTRSDFQSYLKEVPSLLPDLGKKN